MKSINSKSIDSQQLRAIFETAVDCLIIIDSQGVISRINPAGAKLFGYQPEELLGKNVHVLMPTPHRENHNDYIKKHQLTGIKNIIGVGRDVKGQKKDGTVFPCNLSVSEFQSGEERCFAGIIHDLTERKKAEDEIMELNRQLAEKVEVKSKNLSDVINKLLVSNKQLEEEVAEGKKIEEALRLSELELRGTLQKEKELHDLKSRFVSMASHEFRTPLSTILSSTSLIERYLEKEQPERTGKHFNRVKVSVQHLTEILEDFLSLTKLAEGKIPTNIEEFYIQDFFNAFVKTNQGLLKLGQQLRYHPPFNNSLVVMDKRLLNHILLNLLSNAIKYSEEGSNIDLNVQVSDNQLVIQVVDEGIGIPAGDQKHLFSRFFRGSNAINIKGTGLGLNIIKEYLDLMGGQISFESKEYRGTTFTVILPIKNGTIEKTKTKKALNGKSLERLSSSNGK